MSLRRYVMGASGLALTGCLLALVGIAWHASPLAPARAQEPSEGGGLPPLVIDKSLRLDEPDKQADTSHLKINQSCFVCHNNYQEEPMVTWHAKEGVGCVDCHGKSLAHRNDEDNITPPDVMFRMDTIEKACQECHEEHIAWPRDVLALWQQRCPEKEDFSTVVCTDCHGQHRLERRVVQWDKRTGKLQVRKPKAEDPAAAKPGQ